MEINVRRRSHRKRKLYWQKKVYPNVFLSLAFKCSPQEKFWKLIKAKVLCNCLIYGTSLFKNSCQSCAIAGCVIQGTVGQQLLTYCMVIKNALTLVESCNFFLLPNSNLHQTQNLLWFCKKGLFLFPPNEYFTKRNSVPYFRIVLLCLKYRPRCANWRYWKLLHFSVVNLTCRVFL